MSAPVLLCPQCREIAAVADAPCADCVTVDRLAAAFARSGREAGK